MNGIIEFLGDPIVALIVLAVLAVEGLVLGYLWRFRAVGVPPATLFWFLAAGAAFAVALWFALSDGNPVGMGIALAIALVCHIMDLRQRWQS